MSSDQKLQALRVANNVRSARVLLRKGMKTGGVSLWTALNDPCVERMLLGDLLVWQPGWGPVRAKRALRKIGWGGDFPEPLVGRIHPLHREVVCEVCRRFDPPSRAAA